MAGACAASGCRPDEPEVIMCPECGSDNITVEPFDCVMPFLAFNNLALFGRRRRGNAAVSGGDDPSVRECYVLIQTMRFCSTSRLRES